MLGCTIITCKTIADNLTFRALQVTPHARDFDDFLYNMVIADDLHYGLLYYFEIADAFANHGIYWPYNSAQNSNMTLSKQQPNLHNLDVNLTNNILETKLMKNYPNPFNPTTIISYKIKEPGFVSLKVYDVIGREVAELVNENKNIGIYSVKFDASELASGIYLYRITTNNYVETKKMLFAK